MGSPRLLSLALRPVGLFVLVACAALSARAQVTFNEDVQVVSVLSAAGSAMPIFNCSFTVQPAAALNYQWWPTDSSDTAANQAVHQGLAYLNGAGFSQDSGASSYAYIDLNAATGPNSCGASIPMIGYGFSYAYSFEFVIKFSYLSQQGWAKILDMGDGNGVPAADDFTISFDGADLGHLLVESYINSSYSPAASLARHGITEFYRNVQANTWYHIVLGVQAINSTVAGSLAANWFVWVNGNQQNYADTLVSGAILTAIQGANFPLPVYRSQSYVGRSNWQDPMLNATIDSFRFYNYLLPTSTVQSLASIYNSNIPVPYPTSAYTPATTTETTNFNSILTSNGAAQPIFNAPFSSSPYSAAGTSAGSAVYTWLANDPADTAAVQQYHNGVVVLNGTAPITLMAATGPNSIGQVLPSVVGGGSGFSVEMVVKATATQTWTKLIDLGTGPGYDSTAIGWYSNSNQWEVEQYVNLVGTGLGLSTQQEAFQAFVTPTVGQWYHVMVTMTPANASTWTGTWLIYLNGVQAANVSSGNYPTPITRISSWIGGSEWGDPPAQAVYDAVRIYNYAVTPTMVQQLAAMYNLSAAASSTGPPSGTVTFNEDVQVTSVLSTAGSALPFFNCSFTIQPAASLNYQWWPMDSSDTAANQSVHQGLAYLNGAGFSQDASASTYAYIDLNAATGPNTCGAAIPMIGAGLSSAYSFEFVIKFPFLGQGWAKILDMGDGNGVPAADDFTISFNGGDSGKLLVESYINSSYSAAASVARHGITEFYRNVQAATWYHIVLGVQSAPGTIAGSLAANWFVWVNGNQLNYADSLVSGAILTAIQGANFPLPVYRSQSYVGRSNWQDPMLSAVIDSFRFYNYLLPTSTVQSLASIYNLNIPVPYPTSAYTPATTTETTNFNSILTSNGAAQPIFNAPFSSSPYSAAGTSAGSAVYTWVANDPADSAAVQQYHNGLLVINGSTPVNLMAVSGPTSIGQVLPSVVGGGSGFSVEMVVKVTGTRVWSKLVDLGSGPSYDSTAFGWYSSSNQWEVEQYVNVIQNGVGLNTLTMAFLPFLTPNIAQWYHVLVSMTPTNASTYLGNWTIYVNGQVAATTASANYPLPITRISSYIGGSDWPADATSAVTFDALRVYSYAVTPTMVSQLAAMYNLSIISAAPAVTFNEDVSVNAVLNTAGSARPIFNCSFTTRPAASLNYAWNVMDTSDSQANQAVHQGLAVLSGSGFSQDASASSYAYIDLNAATGPNTCGAAIPMIGAGLSSAYSFEFVIKFPLLAQGWAKILDMGDGNGVPAADDFTISFNGGDSGKLLVESYINSSYSAAASVARHGITEFYRNVQAATWYHIVLGVQSAPGTIAGSLAANWFVWVNGNQLNYADSLVSGAILTAIQGANFPLPVYRSQSYVGRSNWQDPMLSAVIDSFRFYNYLLPTSTVQSLASIYNLNIPVPYPTSAYTPASTTETQAVNTVLSNNGAAQPIFNAPFSSSPYSAAGTAAGSAVYTWLANDPNDNTTVAQYHNGVLVLNGTAVSLTTASGPNSIGQVLPSVVGGGNGFSVELVVKAVATQTWTKLIDLGTGPGYDSTAIGWYGTTGQWEVEQYVNTIQNGVGLSTLTMAFQPFLPPVVGQWYHVMVTMTPTNTSTYLGSWNIYVNGQGVSSLASGNYPLPITRISSYIGGSDWTADAGAFAVYDAVRVYNYAVTPTMVSQLAAIYNLNIPPPPPYSPPPSIVFPASPEDNAVAAVVPRMPVMNCGFNTNPTSYVGGAINYQWAQMDPSDTAANQQLHQGVVLLRATSTSYIDVSTNTGPQSAGCVMPIMGSSYAGLPTGWSFEFVVKFATTQQGWTKLLDLGNGPYMDDMTVTFFGTDAGRLAVEQYNNASVYPLTQHGLMEFSTPPQAGVWYHIVVTMQPASSPWSAGAANWYIYVNGQQLKWADALSSGAALTAVQGANYPLPVPRQQSYIGKSDWSDPFFNGTFDAVRAYDYLLTPSQVQALANIYQLNIPSTPQTSVSFPADPETASMNSIVSRPAVFNANFASSPYAAVGTTAAAASYKWMQSDPNDAPSVAQWHQGLVQLNGSYIDLTTASGPNSVGLVLPIIGGAGWAGGSSQGLSIEVVIKVTAVETWSKLIDLGTGSFLDSLAIGWYSTTDSIELESYNNIPSGNPAFIHETTLPFLSAPQLNSWYHIVVVMTPSSPIASNSANTAYTWSANDVVYVNGVQVATANASLANYPLPIYRQNAYIGRSNWQADANALAVYDALRIYDYALPSNVIPLLAASYGLNSGPTATSTGVYSPVGSGGGGNSLSSSSSSSGLSHGAIAGIVIGSVAGAALLLVILFFVCRGAGSGKKADGTDSRGSRRLDEEHSHMGEHSAVELEGVHPSTNE